ncbi:hypothetical protein DV737_g2543, partial [Chaetothyriales sp. CBS 132003]
MPCPPPSDPFIVAVAVSVCVSLASIPPLPRPEATQLCRPRPAIGPLHEQQAAFARSPSSPAPGTRHPVSTTTVTREQPSAPRPHLVPAANPVDECLTHGRPRPRRRVDRAAAPSRPSTSLPLLPPTSPLTSPSTHAEPEHGHLGCVLGSAHTHTAPFPMTTAVASPPTFQSLPRLGWNGANTGGGFSAMSTEDVSRIFIPQRKVQRSSSSSSLSSTLSSASTASTLTATAAAEPQLANGADSAALPAKKKARGGFWPVSKAESTSGLSSARANGSLQLSGKSAVQPTGAILALQPINGTFDRKQINVPFFPDVLRVGRQTNAKTVPTPTNGYFDSKVLSRQHAEVWAERSGKVWIRDVKSSNGTFVNGQRLSHENKESEPHELHAQDTLELGIDIVSEDQKTIVHHKVSARVEYVGLPAASNNVLDLSFGDLDPSHSASLLPSPMSTPMMHSRGRPGPAGPNPGGRSSLPPSLAAGQMGAGQQSRQMNFWGQTTPLSVEQLVKSIAVELRAARQQATEIDQVGFYLDAFPAPAADANARKDRAESAREAKTKFKSPRTDHLTRFAEPPAPPPQQPLPEKPDGGAKTSPNNSQMLQLIDALSVAKKELDSQATRVKQLEDMLKEERSARAHAEERARCLEHASVARPVGQVEQAVDASSASPADEHDTAQRLDATLADMQRMKAEVDGWKRRADAAEVPLEHVVTTVLRKDENGEVLVSAPYVSMLGVVLIGVGLMAYLNSWQKTDRQEDRSMTPINDTRAKKTDRWHASQAL